MSILCETTLTTDALSDELMSEILTREHGFTMAKTVCTVKTRRTPDGAEWLLQPQLDAEINRAAVQLLQERYPELQIRFTDTVLSETTVYTAGNPNYQTLFDTEKRTDAEIEVPEQFVRRHNGADFREILTEKWSAQLDDLTARVAARLEKHEMRTAVMFGDSPTAAASVFRVTEDTVESDIWVIPLSRCGLYPLQWDGEICGLSLLLAGRLKETLAPHCGTLLETAVRRVADKKQCTVTIYYSIKQD